MMEIRFAKLHGLGNDYVFIDLVSNKYSFDPSALARKISDRHFGVGSDGLILILPSKKADFRMRIFNADGSEAEMCGNGIRGLAKYCFDHGLCKRKITVETGAGIKAVSLNVKNGKAVSSTVDMGEPILDGLKVPTIVNRSPVVGEKISIGGRAFSFTAVSMGNPHCVIFVDKITDDLVSLGSIIERHRFFPGKANVEFARIIDKGNIEMRVWERGSGETLACGTGACATAVAGFLNKKTGRKVTVSLLGGRLEIEWAADNHVYMTGPAEEPFEGVYHYDEDSKMHEHAAP